ncbi:MAG: PH domain-containing protein [Gordonia sp. (in: high G+C Gram-positive bacteria)]|uniref:PH domain-containing protein n=1 Tax=Gordonia sp. (in: high G+C Gram-positive bacteria) TaxID=84139 RepID=UPI003BB7E1AC
MSLNLLDADNPQLTPVSPKLATVRRLSASALCAPIGLLGAVLAVLAHPAFWALTALALVGYAWWYWIIGRQVSAHRYREDSDDLIVARGRWWRQVTVVPYGRIQFIDLGEGPLLRMYGLASLHLNTASAGSDAVIDGLGREQARALRERLSERARERMAGL